MNLRLKIRSFFLIVLLASSWPLGVVAEDTLPLRRAIGEAAGTPVEGIELLSMPLRECQSNDWKIDRIVPEGTSERSRVTIRCAAEMIKTPPQIIWIRGRLSTILRQRTNIPIAVRAGAKASMEAFSENAHISILVICLRNASVGDRIRVRAVGGDQLFFATVLSPGHVREGTAQ